MNHLDDSDLINGIENMSDDLTSSAHSGSRSYDDPKSDDDSEDVTLGHPDIDIEDISESEVGGDMNLETIVEEDSVTPFYKSKPGVIAIGSALSFGLLGLLMFLLSGSEQTMPKYAQSSQYIEQPTDYGSDNLEEDPPKSSTLVGRDSRFTEMESFGLPTGTTDLDGSEKQDPNSNGASIDLEDMKSSITDSISNSISSLSASIETSMSQLHENQQAAEQENRSRLASLGNRVEEFLGDVKLLSSDVAKNRASITKLMEKQDSLTKLLLAKNSPAPTPEGRSRIPGYRILDSTPDQEMVVVSTPNGQLKALFKGENISIQGESVEIQDIANDGRTVLVGSTFFIDKGYTPLTVQETTESVSGDEDVTTVSYASGRSTVKTQIATNWSLNAVFKEGFLIKTPKGVFTKVRLGDDIDSLGVVRGLNSNGDLIVGPNLIRSIR